MNICVIEDQPDRHNFYHNALAKEFQGEAEVCPSYNEPCLTWERALDLIKGLPEIEPLLLLVDLQLQGDANGDAGLQHCVYLHRSRPSAVIICISSWARTAYYDGERIFDRVLDLQLPENKNLSEFVKRLPRIAREVWADKTGSTEKTPVMFEDSFAFRLAEAALGADRLRGFFPTVANGWTDCVVRALTHGASGAYIFHLCGRSNGTVSDLVFKIARDRTALEREAKAFKDAEPHLGIFTGRFSVGRQEIREFDGFFYTQQPLVRGDSLYGVIRNGPEKKARAALESVLKLLTRQYEIAMADGPRPRLLAEQFALGETRSQFLHYALDRFQPTAEFLHRHHNWPKDAPTPKVAFASVRDLVDRWPAFLQMPAPYWTMQHGDLHAGNIVTDVDPVFIDPPRLGLWPIGYDMSRLATHARVHLPAQIAEQDWIDGDLRKWGKAHFADFNPKATGEVCAWAAQTDQAFHRFLRHQAPAIQPALLASYQFCTLSDLLRMINYPTLSHFKRIWVVLACHELKQRLTKAHPWPDIVAATPNSTTAKPRTK